MPSNSAGCSPLWQNEFALISSPLNRAINVRDDHFINLCMHSMSVVCLWGVGREVSWGGRGKGEVSTDLDLVLVLNILLDRNATDTISRGRLDDAFTNDISVSRELNVLRGSRLGRGLLGSTDGHG